MPAIVYNGALGPAFGTLVNDYNHAFLLFVRVTVGDGVKIRVADNVVARLLTVIGGLNGDPAWVQQQAADVNGVQYLINSRQILGNLQHLRTELDRLRTIEPGLNAQYATIDQIYHNYEQQTVLAENTLNRTFGNKVLRAIEITAAVGLAVGLIAVGVGAIAWLGGYLAGGAACTCTCAATGATGTATTVGAGTLTATTVGTATVVGAGTVTGTTVGTATAVGTAAKTMSIGAGLVKFGITTSVVSLPTTIVSGKCAEMPNILRQVVPPPTPQ